MRVTYRSRDVKDYWTARWSDIPADKPMTNLNAYPLKYAEMVVQDLKGNVLEAGCGAGRILRYYHDRNVDIIGFDYVGVAVEKLKKIDPTLKVEVGDITNLRFKDNSFKYILAFGLYHNLEYGLKKSIQETYRVLENEGVVCASFRADNIQTRITDWLTNKKQKKLNSEELIFHKMNLTRKEYKNLFANAGFCIDRVIPVENMPILYKFAIFRANEHKHFNENFARTDGYKLSVMGNFIQKNLMRFFPNQFCNIYVMIARKCNK